MATIVSPELRLDPIQASAGTRSTGLKQGANQRPPRHSAGVPVLSFNQKYSGDLRQLVARTSSF